MGEKKQNLNGEKYVLKDQLVPFDKCIRVQTDFFINNDRELIRVNKSVIEDDYGKGKSRDVKKYFAFVNEPNHINYEEDVNRYFNLYRPIPHEPKKGDWKSIEKLLDHIFKGDDYIKILTYLNVMYLMPKHPLPIIGLVGGKGTGKTKFLEFIKLIYGHNAKVIEPEDLTANFNSSFMDKIAVLIDEKISGKNKNALLQKLKKLSTGGTQTKKTKHIDDVDISFYGKFFMASNDMVDMIALEDENTRFWIIDVGELSPEKKDLDLLDKVEKEIPAFLYFLQHEFKPLERASRTWISEDTYQTDRSRIMQANSWTGAKKEIISILNNWFENNDKKEEIFFSSEQLFDSYNGKILESRAYIEKTLSKEFKKEATRIRKANPFYGLGKHPGNESGAIDTENYVTRRRFYHFTRADVESFAFVKDEKVVDDAGTEITAEDHERINMQIKEYTQNEIDDEFDDALPF